MKFCSIYLLEQYKIKWYGFFKNQVNIFLCISINVGKSNMFLTVSVFLSEVFNPFYPHDSE